MQIIVVTIWLIFTTPNFWSKSFDTELHCPPVLCWMLSVIFAGKTICYAVQIWVNEK